MRRTLARYLHIALPILLVAVAACGTSEGQIPEDVTTPAVEAVQARYGALPLQERLTGTVRATGQVAIYPETSGPIVEVLAEDGDAVRAGDPLVRIRAETSRSQLRQTRAGLESARAERQQAQANVDDLERRYARSEKLAEDDFISQEEFERLRTQLESARAELSRAAAAVDRAEGAVGESRETVRQTTVRAPIDGRVGRRDAEVGMVATTSTALFTIGKLETMRVEVPVTQEMLSRIRVGQTAQIRTESLPDTVITA